MITEVWFDATPVVVTVNVAVVCPAATVTLPGTVATAVLPLVSVTTAPLAGATAPRVTVPVEGTPPFTVDGLSETVANPAILIVRAAF